MKFLFCFMMCSAAAMAGTITITGSGGPPFADLFGPGNDSGPDTNGSVNVTPTTSSLAGYTFSGTACYQGFCPGQAVAGPGPTYMVNSPLTMTLTSMTLSCGQSGGCSSTATVDADFGFQPVSFGSGTVLPVTVEIDGTAPADFVFQISAAAQAFDTSFNNTEDLSLQNQVITADGSGAFSAMFNLGNLMVNTGFLKADLILTVSNLGDGQSINLPNSFSVTLGGSSSAPEPASMVLMLAGMGGLGMLARKRYSSRNATIGSSRDARRAGK